MQYTKEGLAWAMAQKIAEREFGAGNGHLQDRAYWHTLVAECLRTISESS